MRIIQALPGDSAREHLHRLYFRALEKNETILTHFNGIAVLFFQEGFGFEHQFPSDIDVVKAPYLRELDKIDPTGYEEIEKYIQRDKDELRSLRQKNKELIEQNKRLKQLMRI